MAGEQVVFHDGRYNGRTLREWLPELVEAIRETFDPIQIILFGSVAAGREHRDSDIDLLVVLLKWRTSTTSWSLFLSDS